MFALAKYLHLRIINKINNMKNRLLLLMLAIGMTVSSFAQNAFNLGQNPGNYGTQFTDQQLYDMYQPTGATSTRSVLPYQVYLTSGMATLTARLAYPYLSKNMRQNVICLSVIPGIGTYAGRDTAKINGAQSWLPSGYNLPAFNADGSINTANGYAKYCYDVVQAVGNYFTYFEVWNEPDLTGNWQAATQPTSSTNPGSWQTNQPIGSDMSNMNAPVSAYITLCKIANQVIKKYQPTAQIVTGGIGYAWFYQWFLKGGGGQYIDDLSFHQYPYFGWVYCNWVNGACATTGGAYRNSDMALEQIDSVLDPNKPYSFTTIENSLGAAHIPRMCTESALPGWDYTGGAPFPNNKTYGSGIVQINYWIKAYVTLMCRTDFVYMSLYELGCNTDSANTSGSEIASMGVKYNLNSSTPATAKTNYTGKAMFGMYSVMHNYKSDVTQPVLPAGGINGARWDNSGNKLLVLWAQTLLLDRSEASTGTYTLPAGINFKRYDIWGNYLGIFSGIVQLTGTPSYFVQSSGVVPPSPPVANAGANQTVTMPVSTASLNGSQSVGATNYSWSQTTGPNTSVLSSPLSPVTTASNLIQGQYTYSLTVTNSVGSNANTTTVTVAPSTTLPVANAGAAQTVTLPTTTASLNGSASTGANSYLWSLVSGPNTPVFTSPRTATTTVTGLAAGKYTFELTCTNSNGNNSNNTTVTVNTAKVLTSGFCFISSKAVTLNYSDGSSVTLKTNSKNSPVNNTQSTLTSGKLTYIVTFNDGTKNTYQ